MKGTFVRCDGCGKTLAWGNPRDWQKCFPHSKPGCKGEILVTVQATGCRTRGELGDRFAEIEAWGRDAESVMMDLEDYKVLYRIGARYIGGKGVRLILNGYLIPWEEEAI